MKLLKLPVMWLWLAAFFVSLAAFGQSPVLINEVLFNPPGTDSPNEYIELRGMPSYVLPQGTYFVAVDGDFSVDTNPGIIENVFDLSGRKLGTNGHLVLLQKGHIYAANPSATVIVNNGSGTGFGSGASSSIGHRGEGGKTELDNSSVTFFLIRTTFPPDPGDDIDANDDGIPDGPYLNWAVMDSVGILDNTGPGDFAYGAINYRRNAPPGNQAGASGLIIGVGFTGTYVGRSANTTGSADADWVASNNLNGTVPNWVLPDAANTWPSGFATRALNHIGGPNFGAAAVRGLVITHSGGRTEVLEGGSTDSYTVGLNAAPAGNVVVQLAAPSPIEISTDGGANFSASRTVTFSTTAPQTIVVRAVDDNVVDISPYVRNITHQITSTADPTRFPVTLSLASTPVFVTENDFLLLNEIKVNPPGIDSPYEFVEIRGPPGALLTNVQFLALEGDHGDNPGVIDLAINLSSQRLGANGLLLLAAPGHGYSVSPATTVVTVPALGTGTGVLGNGSASFLLISAQGNMVAGTDLDAGDNGVLEGLPIGTTILDSVGWRDGNSSDVVYGGVMLIDGETPDAAVRFAGNNAANSAAAWFFGELSGTDGASLLFDPDRVSDNFPLGTALSPGNGNTVLPFYFTPIQPIAGAIGDPTNPKVFFTVQGWRAGITVNATSTNAAVVPDANLIVTSLGGGAYSVALSPVGVGYSLINLVASDGVTTARASFRYAASELGRPETRYHTWASDASTAIPIDSDYMFVGDDENQIIRIYRRKQSGDPVAGFDMTPFLGLTDIEAGKPREVDIEASTRVGNRIFWIGAHSHANIAEGRTNRSRIFATDVSGSGAASTLTYAGRYDYLKLDLVNWDVNNVHGKGANYYGLAASTTEGVNPKAPDGSGFNIEGLAMAPFDANVAYVAFRAPIVPVTNRTHALIVPVLNFASLAVSTGPPGSAIFGAPIELDLYGRGIRSIEGVGGNYLIVAGVPGDFPGEYPHDFRLYTWTGNPADAPRERATDLSELNPEGIIELPQPPWSPNSLVYLVSDSGRKIWYGDDVTAKAMTVRNFKKFRTDTVVLGSVVKTTPQVTFMEYRQSGFTIGWRSVAGERYLVHYKSSFSEASWTPLGTEVLATGTFASKTDPNPPPPQRFYKVMVLP